MKAEEFFAHCFRIGDNWFISPRQAYPLAAKGTLLIDLRPAYENAGKVPDVPSLLQCSYEDFDSWQHQVPKNQPVILADAVGIRSKEIMLKLKNMGFNQIASLAGGLFDWEREGFPVTFDIREQLSGGCMCQLRKRHKD